MTYQSVFMLHTRLFFAVIAFCCVWQNTLNAQGSDAMAEVRTHNVIVLPPRSLEFELVLTNRSGTQSSNAWQRWANGTFLLTVTNVNLAGARLDVDSSGLPLERIPTAGIAQTRSGYETLTIVQGARQRLGIVILGADSVENTILLLPDSSRVLGRFRLTLADTIQDPAKVQLAWAQSTVRFQANAFKTEQLRTVQGKVHNRNDNVEMPTRYFADAASVELEPTVALAAMRLQAEYVGDKRVRVRWTTTEERVGRRTNAGFVLLRQLMDTHGVGAFDTVASFLRISDLRLRGASNGAAYEYRDSVPTRGDVYAYRLGFLDATVRPAQGFRAVFSSDTAQTAIPNAVLSSAIASPNPFAESTIIRYTLLDRARMTALLYDATGRIVREVFADVERPRGEYTFALDGSALPNQAAYFLILTALPVNDTAVERSQTILKLQLSR
jgi:hypothetical protein